MTIDSLNEEYFPRGGKTHEVKKKRNFVFEKKGLNDPKAKKPGRREREKQKKSRLADIAYEEEENEPVFERFESLTYQRLSEGTLALCSVRQVHENYVDVSMPGRLSARLYIDNVSVPYQNLLNTPTTTEEEEMAEPLERLFKVGQHLSCSVLSVVNQGHYLTRVTSNPAVVNSRLTFAMVSIGMVLQMAVESEEDHGYMMYSGVPGLVSFLPKSNISATNLIQQKPYFVGQIVWCVVTQSKLTGSSNTIHVSLDFKKINEGKLVQDIQMDKLMPGTTVDVIIKKVVSQTLLVVIDGTDIHGYIEESHLSTPWSNLQDYLVGSKHPATVLFKFPYARIVALSLKCRPTSCSTEEIPLGTIFNNTEIMGILKRGVCLKLVHNGRSLKGLVSIRRLGDNVDYDSLSIRFPVGNHINCRVIGFDALEQVYSCSTEDNVLNEKYLSVADLQIGQSVDVVVEAFKKGGVIVSIGMVKGFVPILHVTDVVVHNPLEKLRMKSKYKGKILKIDKSMVTVTLRPTLLKSPSLTNFENVQVGEGYFGFVTKVESDSIMVSFFGNLFVRMTNERLIEPAHKYTVGELVKCYVVQKRSEKSPIFSLLKSVQNMALTVGNKYDLIVKEVSDKGLVCFFMSQGQQFNGFLPLEHLSDYPEYYEREIKKYPHGTQISNVCLMSINEKLPLFTLRQSVLDFFENCPGAYSGLRGLKPGMLLPCTVSEVSSNELYVCAPIPGFNGKVLIEQNCLPGPASGYSKYQSVIARVTQVITSNQVIKLSCRLDYENKHKCMSSYVVNLLEYLKTLQQHITGKTVKCRVKEISGNSVNVLIPSTNSEGRLVGVDSDAVKVGDKLKAMVLFQDISTGLVYLHRKDENINLDESPDESLQNEIVSGTTLFMDSYFIVVLARVSPMCQNLVFIPKSKDPNHPLHVEVVDVAQFTPCRVTLRSVHQLLGEKSIYFWVGNNFRFGHGEKKVQRSENEINSVEDSKPPVKQLSKKLTHIEDQSSKLGKRNQKNDEEKIGLPDEIDVQKPKKSKRKGSSEMDSTSNLSSQSNNKKRSKNNDNDEIVEVKAAKKKKHSLLQDTQDDLMADAASFNWDATTTDLSKAIFPTTDDLSQDDSDEEVLVEKKPTAKEKKAAAAEREREIREKEEELLQAESKPQSAEHFDRLLTATPNNSKLWIMYMAHHMQATEIEKARSVAKRALKHINIRLEDERLNVWIASLNLENMYGTPDSFKEVLTEALKYNDDYKVQQRVLDIYAESKKIPELERLVNQLLKKYKDKVDCWLSCQEALMKAGIPDKARSYLQRSLEALPNKEYCTLISRFALVENKFGYADQAQSLFENLLTSYPKRIDLWFVYIDMLIKSGSIALARSVLERATSQKLPIRKMKSLYQKWQNFEEKHGTPESVEEVKKAAEAYVSKLTSGLD